MLFADEPLLRIEIQEAPGQALGSSSCAYLPSLELAQSNPMVHPLN